MTFGVAIVGLVVLIMTTLVKSEALRWGIYTILIWMFTITLIVVLWATGVLAIGWELFGYIWNDIAVVSSLLWEVIAMSFKKFFLEVF